MDLRGISIAMMAWLQAAMSAFAQPARPFPGLLGMPLPKALRTDFFTFFHLEETGRQTSGGTTVVHFKPSGAGFRERVTLEATVADGGKIASIRLDLARQFIAGSQAVFANDIAKSLLADGPPAADRAALGPLVDEIQSNRNANGIVLSAQKPPPPPAMESDGYLTYLGKRQSYSRELTVCSLRLENSKQDSGEWLRIELAAKP
ncbi:MAG: hypothetical protein ABSH49_23630 [Bryobacteraceae bacterium]|jgi:hypothetical protein